MKEIIRTKGQLHGKPVPQHGTHARVQAVFRLRLVGGWSLLAIALTALVISNSNAATYFVDFAAGSNSNNGTSENSSWKHCPGDPDATAGPANVALSPGDRIKFKGGIVYFGSVIISRSGSSDAPILYDGNHTGEWGTGRAVMDLQHVAGTLITGIRNVSNIVVRGFELRNAGGYADDDPILMTTCADAEITDTPVGVGVSFVDGGNRGIRLENLYLHRLGNWRNTEPFSGVNSVTGVGITIQDCDGVVIKNCELTKMRIGFSIKASKQINGIDIDGCDLHDYIVWGFDIAPRAADAKLSNISIRNTKIHDYHQHDSGNWLGCGEKPHTDGIFLRSAGLTSTWTNIVIQGCEFYADYPENSAGGTASIYVSQGPSVTIFNNTFRSDAHTRSIGVGHSNPSGMEQVVRIYNNSFFNSATPIVLAGETNTAKRKVYIQNNIFSRSGQANAIMVNHDSGVLPAVLDRNVYWDPGNPVTVKYVLYSGGYKRFSDVRALGYEANGFFVDPGFAFTNASLPSGNDLRLITSGGAVARGANLSGFFSTDKDGQPRAATGNWDIGAYISGATRSVEAPSNLRRVTAQ